MSLFAQTYEALSLGFDPKAGPLYDRVLRVIEDYAVKRISVRFGLPASRLLMQIDGEWRPSNQARLVAGYPYEDIRRVLWEQQVPGKSSADRGAPETEAEYLFGLLEKIEMVDGTCIWTDLEQGESTSWLGGVAPPQRPQEVCSETLDVRIINKDKEKLAALCLYLSNAFWDYVLRYDPDFTKEILKIRKAAYKRQSDGGGSNRKWIDLGRPVHAANPGISKSALAAKLLDEHGGDRGTVMRALSPFYPKNIKSMKS